MQEGSRMHRKIQGRMGMEYRAEVPLKLEVPQEQYVLALEGRADGIITNADGVTVDEIKCMYTQNKGISFDFSKWSLMLTSVSFRTAGS